MNGGENILVEWIAFLWFSAQIAVGYLITSSAAKQYRQADQNA